MGFLDTLLMIWQWQRILIYPSGYEPHPRYVAKPSCRGIPYEDAEIVTPDKVTLRCYLMFYGAWISRGGSDVSNSEQRGDARATVIMFHGNGVNHGDGLPVAMQFLRLRCNVLTVSYRGYGHSSGSPSEKGLQKDAQSALDHVLEDGRLAGIPVIIFGQSLGGAVAIDVASKNSSNIQALIIENTFTSVPRLVRDLPVIGRFSFICTQRWNSASKMAKMSPELPILMLCGQRDTVVPPKHMHALCKLAVERGGKKLNNGEELGAQPQPNCSFKSFSMGSHMDTWTTPTYWEAVGGFIDQLDSPIPVQESENSYSNFVYDATSSVHELAPLLP